MIDSLPRNVGAYIAFFALAILVGALESTHQQYQATRTVNVYDTLDAIAAYILPTLTMMLLAMKLPSVGGEAPAAKVQDVRESLIVETPAEHHAETVTVDPAPTAAPRRVRPSRAKKTVEVKA